MNQPVLPRRRRFALSLRALMVLVLVIGGVLGWKVRRATIQRRAVAAITAAGGSVVYDYEIAAAKATGGFIPNAEPWAPSWLRQAIGNEYFQEVDSIFLQNYLTTQALARQPGLFEAVAQLDQIDMLNSLRYPINDSDFGLIMTMPRMSSVCLIDIDITEAGLESVASSPAIEELRFRSKPGVITARGLEIIARQPRIKNLEIILIDLTDPRSLAPLAKLTQLESLNLQQSPPDDSCLASLKDLTHLKRIDLRRTQLTDAGIDYLAKLDKLERLMVDGSKLTNAGLARLAAIPSLQQMYIDPLPDLGEVGLTSLDKLAGFPTLVLKASNVTDAGLTHLKGMSLEKLEISGSGVTDAGLAMLASKNQFRELILCKTSITGAGLSGLTTQLGLNKLKLTGLTIDEAGATTLASLPTLDVLSLDQTSLNDEGLAELQAATRLRELDIRATQVTPAGLAAFQKARPGVKVRSGPIDR